MIVLVTASRSWNDAAYIERTLDKLLDDGNGDVLVLVHGDCPTGGDAIADRWALRRQVEGKPVLIVRHPAKWTDDNGVFDRRAGFRRNAAMVQAVKAMPRHAEAHAFIRNKSSGATHCANEASKAGIPTVRHRWEEREATGQ